MENTYILILVLLALHWLPALVAVCRRATNTGAVVAVNFFFGWTVLGWFIALVMALKKAAPAQAQPPAFKAMLFAAKKYPISQN